MTVPPLFPPAGPTILPDSLSDVMLSHLLSMSIAFFRKFRPRDNPGPPEANAACLLTDRHGRSLIPLGGQIKNLFSIRRIGHSSSPQAVLMATGCPKSRWVRGPLALCPILTNGLPFHQYMSATPSILFVFLPCQADRGTAIRDLLIDFRKRNRSFFCVAQ